MSMYPFRFKIGDFVRVVAGHHEGQTGTVKALELSERRTVAVIMRGDHKGPLREVESNLRTESAF